MISNECKKASNESINKNTRYMQIRDVLKNKEMTAKEIAVAMRRKKYTQNADRNNAAPRLTELEMIHHLVVVVGKKKCKYTGKIVSVYKFVEDVEKWEQIKLNLEVQYE